MTNEKSVEELLEFGIINIDKSSGPTSFNVSDFVRKKLKEIYPMRKTSHFGTLDPKVTGVLPVALNRACKLTGYFIGEDKEYVGVMRIHEDVDINDIKKIIKKKFLGKIKQTPPVKSRVKRQEREREVKRFDLLEKDRKNIVFHVECQGGTYIRKLIDDLGKELRIGAHMLELRRVRAGIFLEKDSVNLYDFEKAVDKYKKGNKEDLKKIIIPAEIVSDVYPIVKIKKDRLKQILTGKPIYRDDLEKTLKNKKGEIVCVFNKEKFIGMYEIVDGKEIVLKSKFVMQDIN